MTEKIRSFTLPETNSSPAKMDGWKMSVSLLGGVGLFSGAKRLLASGRGSLPFFLSFTLNCKDADQCWRAASMEAGRERDYGRR